MSKFPTRVPTNVHVTYASGRTEVIRHSSYSEAQKTVERLKKLGTVTDIQIKGARQR